MCVTSWDTNPTLTLFESPFHEVCNNNMLVMAKTITGALHALAEPVSAASLFTHVRKMSKGNAVQHIAEDGAIHQPDQCVACMLFAHVKVKPSPFAAVTLTEVALAPTPKVALVLPSKTLNPNRCLAPNAEVLSWVLTRHR
jgi:hypothetical protein